MTNTPNPHAIEMDEKTFNALRQLVHAIESSIQDDREMSHENKTSPQDVPDWCVCGHCHEEEAPEADVAAQTDSDTDDEPDIQDIISLLTHVLLSAVDPQQLDDKYRTEAHQKKDEVPTTYIVPTDLIVSTLFEVEASSFEEAQELVELNKHDIAFDPKGRITVHDVRTSKIPAMLKRATEVAQFEDNPNKYAFYFEELIANAPETDDEDATSE